MFFTHYDACYPWQEPCQRPNRMHHDMKMRGSMSDIMVTFVADYGTREGF